MKKAGKILAVLSSVVLIVVTYFLEEIFGTEYKCNIPLGHLIAGCIVALFIIVTLYSKINENKSEAEKQINELEEKVALSEKTVAMSNNLDIGSPKAKGNSYLLMALSQNNYEPLKIEMLKKSAEDYHNVLAALILGSMYESGVECDGKTVLKKDRNKAYALYEKVNGYDDYGVTDWLLGFAYEKNRISAGKELPSDSERRAIAYKYYEASLNKGYPKAYNSLGKFYQYGWIDGTPDKVKATGNFAQAAELDDVYATLNCGHLQMKDYLSATKAEGTLLKAEAYFKKASEFNNAEAWLFLGIVSEEKIELYKNDKDKDKYKYINDAVKYYKKSFEKTGSQYSAAGLYRLGLLINNYPQLKTNQSLAEALNADNASDLEIKCFSKAYIAFEKLILEGNTLSGQYASCYNELSKSFKEIKSVSIY